MTWVSTSSRDCYFHCKDVSWVLGARSQAGREGTTAASLVSSRETLMFPAGMTKNRTHGTQLRHPMTHN